VEVAAETIDWDWQGLGSPFESSAADLTWTGR
jgi:hypothetical protein